MRINSVAAVALALALLAGCQGGDRIAKAANAPASNGGADAAGSSVDPNPELKCLAKCREKADEKHLKCLKSDTPAVCGDALSEAQLQCNEKCVP